MLDDRDQVHETLFSETTLKLGEIHWTLMKSTSVTDGQRWQDPTYETTTFGKEVGLDEIHSWALEFTHEVSRYRNCPKVRPRIRQTEEGARTPRTFPEG